MELTRIDEILNRKANELKAEKAVMQNFVGPNIPNSQIASSVPVLVSECAEKDQKIKVLTNKVKTYKIATFATAGVALVAIITAVIIILKRK